MIRTNEHLRYPDTAPRKEAEEAFADTHPAYDRMKDVCELREAMLSSLEADISASFYEALNTKIRYERDSLLAQLEADMRAANARKKLRTALKTEYFIQKPLDTDIS